MTCVLNERSAGVCMQLATQIVASLLALEASNENQDIQLYINSQGKPIEGFAQLLQRQFCICMIQANIAEHSTAQLTDVCTAGGSPYATIAILDVMDAIKCDVSTVAFGMCASTATLLLVRPSIPSCLTHASPLSFCAPNSTLAIRLCALL